MSKHFIMTSKSCVKILFIENNEVIDELSVTPEMLVLPRVVGICKSGKKYELTLDDLRKVSCELLEYIAVDMKGYVNEQ